MSTFNVCLKHNVRLQVEWIPQEENDKADYICKIVDHDDWQLDANIFWQLDYLWGPQTVDQFADD